MMHSSPLQMRALPPDEMRQVNGGELFPTILSTTVADVVNSINNINIEPEGGCHLP